MKVKNWWTVPTFTELNADVGLSRFSFVCLSNLIFGRLDWIEERNVHSWLNRAISSCCEASKYYNGDRDLFNHILRSDKKSIPAIVPDVGPKWHWVTLNERSRFHSNLPCQYCEFHYDKFKLEDCISATWTKQKRRWFAFGTSKLQIFFNETFQLSSHK